MTVDFTSIPDGTTVLAGNLYQGILFLDAMGGSLWRPASVSAGVLANDSIQADPRWQSRLFGAFVRPVAEVTLTMQCPRRATCSYQGWDGQHGFNTLNQVIPGSPDWQTVSLTVPAGGYLVSFEIDDRDDGQAGGVVFFIKNVSFTVIEPPAAPTNLHVVA